MVIAIISLVFLVVVLVGYKVVRRNNLNPGELSLLQYENFGHNFSIAELVESVLKPATKPEFTSWSWNTENDDEWGLKILKIRLYSSFDTEKCIEDHISLERSSKYLYRDEPYAQIYLLRNGKLNYGGCPTVRTLVKFDLKDSAEAIVKRYQEEFKSETSGPDLSGVI